MYFKKAFSTCFFWNEILWGKSWVAILWFGHAAKITSYPSADPGGLVRTCSVSGDHEDEWFKKHKPVKTTVVVSHLDVGDDSAYCQFMKPFAFASLNAEYLLI